jgi:LysM domain
VRSIVQAYVLELAEETDMTTMTVTPLGRTRGSASGLHLTRRGRLTVTVFGALLASVLLGLGHLPATQATDRPSTISPTSTVVVHPGETLWQIAERLAPAKDPRVMVHRIEELNGLTGAAVTVGQSLYVPA